MGYDTMDANIQLGRKPDERDYTISALILKDLGISTVSLMTNNPDKIQQLEQYGIRIHERVPLYHESWHNSIRHTLADSGIGSPVDEDRVISDLDRYFHTKVTRMNHLAK